MNGAERAREARTEEAVIRGRRWIAYGLAAAAVGAAGVGLALVLDAGRALHAYLTAYLFGLSFPLGALCLLMIAHVSGARWFVVVRRLAEGVAGTIPLFALLLVPVLLGMDVLYPWARPLETLPHRLQEAVALKDGFLNPGFFLLRAGVYFAVWIVLAALFWRWSVRQDAEGGGVGRPVALSAAGLPAFAFTVTFAAIDWAMSLEPEWSATIYGAYYFAGAFLGGLAVMVLLARGIQRSGLLRGEVAESHFHALGRLTLTFVVFWAYIAFAQGFIVWIADEPSEVAWYLARWEGGWAWVLVLLIVGHFALPFFALLSRELKRRPRRLAAVAGWLVLMHWVDVYWLVMPGMEGHGPWPGWEQPAAVLAVAGAAVAFGAWRMTGRPAAPLGDPEFQESIRYESR